MPRFRMAPGSRHAPHFALRTCASAAVTANHYHERTNVPSRSWSGSDKPIYPFHEYILLLPDVIAMKRTTLITCICSMVLVATLLGAGCTSAPPAAPATPVPTPVPTETTAALAPQTCVPTSCHGLDLACGATPAQSCTHDYQPGDKCRQYAQCSVASDGSCSTITGSQYNSCKACVQKCELRGGDDSLAAATCEESC